MKRTAFSTALFLGLAACGVEPTSARGFRLPDGDPDAGRSVFASRHCVDCHSVEGAEFDATGSEQLLDVRIGGKVLRVRTYGELVTAVINPSHRLTGAYAKEVGTTGGDSPMPDYNQEMTVQELIDLVAFLQSTYTEHLPQDYDPYFP